jgi:ubiquinone/menaquinone biosynthesis C-methylase UbiE
MTHALAEEGWTVNDVTSDHSREMIGKHAEVWDCLASKTPRLRSPHDYYRLVKRYYDGPAGWFTLLSGVLTGHETLAHRVISPAGFDVSACHRILDAGCGNGRYLRFVLRRATRGAIIVGCDLSYGMLERARRRLAGRVPPLQAADVRQLPYRSASFDAIVCGWMLEHLQDMRVGLRELARVLCPGGKLLLLTTEQSLTGALCSRVYHSRMTSRAELRAACADCGLQWHRELWWSSLHRLLGLGGIVVEVRRA